MNCNDARALLQVYLDGELDRAGARELEAHLDGCAECARSLSELDGLRAALRTGAPRYAAPAALREQIRAHATPTRVSAPRLGRWLALAASWALAFVIGVRVSGPASSDSATTLARDLVSSHLRALAAANPVDVASSDRHTVKPWFAGKIAFAPPAADFAEQGFALVGGRIDYVGDTRVAVLVYRHGPHLVDVFVLPGAATEGLERAGVGLGYRATRTQLAGTPAVIVSDMDTAESQRLGALLAAE